MHCFTIQFREMLIWKYSGIFSTLLLWFALISPAVAQNSTAYFGFGLVRSHMLLNPNELPGFILSDSHEDEAGVEGTLGCQFQRSYIELQASANIISSGFSSLFGMETLSYFKVQVTGGYDFPIGTSNFTLGPELSLASITMTAREGALFNPGEEEEAELDGNGWGVGLRAKWRMSNAIHLKFSYSYDRMQFIDQVDGILSIEFHL